MKTDVTTWAVLLLIGLFGSSCATVSRLNAEYEEETAVLEQISPEEMAEFDAEYEEETLGFEQMSSEEEEELEKAKRDEGKIDWNEYDD